MEFDYVLTLVPAEMITLQVRDRKEPKWRQKFQSSEDVALCITHEEWVTSLLLISEDIFASYLKY